MNFAPKFSNRTKPICLTRINHHNKGGYIKEDINKSLLVKNIPKAITPRQFYSSIREYGEIKLCKFIVDYYGNSMGSAHVYWYDEKSATTALECLNGKFLPVKETLNSCNSLNQNSKDPSPLEVCYLIPGKTKDNMTNNLYIRNFPPHYNEKDLEKFFSSYGEIKSISICKDEKGESKGYGFISLKEKDVANKILSDAKSRKIIFPNCQPLYSNNAMRKDNLIELKKINYENLYLLFARLRDDMHLIKTKEQFEEEIKKMLHLIMGYEYHPKEIKVNDAFNTPHANKTAVVKMLSPKHVDEFMTKYVQFSMYCLPKILFNYYNKVGEIVHNDINKLIDPVKMFSHFSNLSVVDPNVKPVIFINPNVPLANERTGANFVHRNFNKREYKGNFFPRRNNKPYHTNRHHGYYKESHHNNEYSHGKISKKFETTIYTESPEEFDSACVQVYENVLKKYAE